MGRDLSLAAAGRQPRVHTARPRSGPAPWSRTWVARPGVDQAPVGTRRRSLRRDATDGIR